MIFVVLIVLLWCAVEAMRLNECKKQLDTLEHDMESVWAILDANREELDEMERILEEPETVAYASVEEMEEVKQRIDRLENADFPMLDDKLTEGLQNLLDYSAEIARGGGVIG